MKMNGAQILVKALEDQGVDVIFGYPGGAVLEIFDALRESSIDFVLVRHEQGGAHAASGYARASGKAGVCLATSGPGATNLVTGIATAYMDSVPLVAITGQVPKAMVGTDAFQEVDITGITSPITKYNYLVQDVKNLPKIVAEAFYIAQSGRPGPVLIDIPRDVSMAVAEYVPYKKVDIRSYKPTLKGHPTMIKNALKLLTQAEKPVICTGGGVISSGAHEEVKKLANLTGAKVVSTMMGLGAFPGNHPDFLGMLGTYGNEAANLAVQNCDCFLALGMRFDDRVVGDPEKFAPRAKIVHIDIDPAEIGKNIAVDIPIVGDIKNVLRDMIAQLKDITPKTNNDDYPHPNVRIEEGLNAPWVLRTLKRIGASKKLIITTDVGQHQLWAAHHLSFNEPRTLISSGGLGTMGYGIPAAIGAQLAHPEKTVVVITGDGSFQMGMPELGTIAELNLPIKIIIFNNGTLGMVRQLQHHYCNKRYTGVFFKKTVDFMHLAKAYGAEGYRIESADEVPKVFKEALENNKFTIIECPIAQEDLVLPIVLAGDGLEKMVFNP
ncbi:MAG: biosynthetic-type acetolactate synthase large subunit [Clostridia bacterium]|nr:biosynthetic-type acetolactate synthase large subunit [Clostridia bacterium]